MGGVADSPDERLDEILERDEADGRAGVVHGAGEVGAGRTQDGDGLVEPGVRGDLGQAADPLRRDGRGIRAVRAVDEVEDVLDVQVADPGRVVAGGADREAGEAGGRRRPR